MKCIRMNHTKLVRRVDNATARRLVEAGEASYTSKGVWKSEIRDAVKHDKANKAA